MNHSASIWRMGFLLGMVLTIAFVARAQQNVGSILGSVRDPSGAVVPGASVVARAQATGVETNTTTNSAGEYTFPRLDIGVYTLTVGAQGFETVMKENLRVISAVSITVDFNLVVGSSTQSVTIQATPVLVDESTSQTGVTRTGEEVADIPVSLGTYSQRNAEAFLETLGGMTYSNSNSLMATLYGVGFGSYGGYQAYTINGVSGSRNLSYGPGDNSPPAPEEVQEFQVLTNVEPDMGLNLGVAINLVLASGTNRFHGDGYEYLANNVLNSRNFFSSTVSPQRINQFGGIIGGPIRKDKLFFIASYDGYRYRNASYGTLETYPTVAMRSGDFSQLLGAQVGTDGLGRPVYQGEIYDPATTRQLANGAFVRDPFMYNGKLNMIDPARFSSVSTFFQNALPTPTSPGIASNWDGPVDPSPMHINRMTGKIDWNISDRQRLSVGFQGCPTYEINFGYPHTVPLITFDFNDFVNNYHAQIVYTLSLRSNLLYTFSVGLNRMFQDISTVPGEGNGSTLAGLTGQPTTATPYVNISSEASFGFPWDKNGLVDPAAGIPVDMSLAWTKGRHNVKFGSSFFETNGSEHLAYVPTYNFGPAETGMPTFPTTGFGYASYLLGELDSASATTPYSTTSHATAWGLYAMDHWRVTNKLTLTYGLRWDGQVPGAESHYRTGSFDPTVPNAAAGGLLGALSFWGDGAGRNGRHTFSKPNWASFGPRVGFAYAVDPKTVIRGYFGRLYGPYFTEMMGDGSSAPVLGWTVSASRASTNAGVTPAFNWTNGFPAGLLPPTPDLDPTYENGSGLSFLNYNENTVLVSTNVGFGVQRQLPGKLMVAAQYLGKFTHGYDTYGATGNFDALNPEYFSLGNELYDTISPGHPVAGIKTPFPTFNGSVAQALTPYPQYTGVNQVNDMSGFNEYNAVEFTAQKHFGNGLDFLAQYDISKNLSNAGGYQSPYVQRSWKALSPNGDNPQNFVISYGYELPIGPGKPFLNHDNPYTRRLLGGWKILGAQNYYTGSAVAVTSAAGGWANENAGVPIKTSVGCGSIVPGNMASDTALNANAFSTPPPFTFGNTHILPNVRNCGYANENISIIKSTLLKENVNLKFGADFYNAFNRAEWAGFYSSLASPSIFGQVSGAQAPRTIQFHVKIDF